jgi:hypothetical protein
VDESGRRRDGTVKWDRFLSWAVTALVVTVIIIATLNLTLALDSYRMVYRDLGAETGMATDIIIGIPVALYWMMSLAVCALLALKEFCLASLTRRLLLNFLAYLVATLAISLIIRELALPVTGMMKVLS